MSRTLSTGRPPHCHCWRHGPVLVRERHVLHLLPMPPVGGVVHANDGWRGGGALVASSSSRPRCSSSSSSCSCVRAGGVVGPK